MYNSLMVDVLLVLISVMFAIKLIHGMVIAATEKKGSIRKLRRLVRVHMRYEVAITILLLFMTIFSLLHLRSHNHKENQNQTVTATQVAV